HLFRRRGAHPLRSSRGADMGGERRHAHRGARHGMSLISAVTSRGHLRFMKEDFAKKVRRSMRDLQNDARKIISFFQKPSLTNTPRDCEPTYGRINILKNRSTRLRSA